MIKKERGVITYLSQEINELTKKNVVGGIHLVENIDEKLVEKNKENDDMER